MVELDRTVKGLGEISIRVRDLEVMQKFYQEVVGLELLRQDESFVFFRIAPGYGGHPQVLAIFRSDNVLFLDSNSPQVSAATTTLHHIALNIALEDFEKEKRRLKKLGLEVTDTAHAWLHIRSLYFPDPEGNLLEFVCYDESIR